MNNKKQRNRLFTMLMLVMAILMPYGGAWAATSVTTSKPQGEGSSSNPFQISNAQELAWFRDWVNGTYTPKDGESASEHKKACAKLTANIDMSTVCGKNIGSWSPIRGGERWRWCGTFDGNNKTISNLYINSTEDDQGLFGYIHNNTYRNVYICIKNIKFENVNITSTGNNIAALVAYAQTVNEISNIHVLSGTIKGSRSVGGIAGNSNRSNFTNITNHATVIASGSDNTGGIAGSIYLSTLTSCANYGSVTNGKEDARNVGGITGSSQESTISHCANYANIKGGTQVGGIAGKINKGTLETSFTSGNITQTNALRSDYPGLTSDLIVGRLENSPTFKGKIIYNTNSTLTIAGSTATPKAIGYGDYSGSGELLAFTPEELKTGKAAYTLQDNVGDNQDIVWGQHLGTDLYPIPGSTYQVYANNSKFSCTGNPLATEYTNVKPSDDEAKTIVHGTTGSYTYHAITEPTCTQNGNIAYYECNDCHKSFSDQGLTQELSDIIGSQAALGHSYDKNDVCTRCHTSMPILTDDCWFKSVTQEKESKDLAAGYNLYKYIPLTDGDLTIVSSDSKQTLATLWDKEQVTCLAISDSDSPEKGYTHRVSKGETYYIGIREIDGGRINIFLYVNLRDASLLGTGSAEEPFEIKTAEHLAWYRDYVNADNGIPSHHYNACAKLMDDIDLSPICHPADKSKNLKECSWMPIAYNDAWDGIFDGQGHTISNLYINNKNQCTGFFGAINSYSSQRSIIKNIIFENAQVSFYTDNYSSQPVGVLASSCHCADISNVQINSGYVKGKSRLGGVLGYAGDCSLTSCQNKAEITGSNSVGGIIGWCDDSQIKKCINYGNITGNGECGGLFGRITSTRNNQILISYCANYGNIQGQMAVGGIIGRVLGASNVIDHVFVAGNVSKTAPNEDAYVGYLAGSIANATFSGKNIYNGEATTTSSSKLISATIAIGSIEGTCDGQESIISLTTQQIKSGEATYKLNNEKSEGDDLAWYQAIGTDDYPVLTQKENGIVYYAHDFICAQNKYTDYGYRNEDSKTIHDPITGTELDAEQHIYQTGCRREACKLHHYYADPNATLEAVKQSDGSFCVAQMVLTDGEAYDSQAEFTAQQLSYTRSFAHDKWQALYVPFELKCDQIPADYEVATINNFHEFEQKDGSFNTVLEVKPVKNSITIPALTPCLIRLKQAPETAEAKTLQFTNVSFAAAADKKIDCASVTRYYQFLGTLNAKTGFDTTSDFVINEGELWKAGSDTELNPQRWYLNASDRTGSELNPSVQLSRIAIHVIGGDETTGIDGIYVKTDTEDVSSSRQGIYDLQGRKLSVEPTSGIYIKDGKKYVK
mgnify:CR=1 FL=1